MKPTIYVIDDQEAFREECELAFCDGYEVVLANDIDDFESKYDSSKESPAIIVDNSLGRHKALECGFHDWVTQRLGYKGKIILSSVSTDFCKYESELKKYDAVLNKENDVTIELLESVLMH